MKRILFVLSMLVGVAYGQVTGHFRYDSTMLYKNGGNNELILLNGTRNVTGGVLTNIGNGRTRFVTPSGSTNTSIGSGYPVVVNGTNLGKSLTKGSAIDFDTLTSGEIRVKLGGTLASGAATVTGTSSSSPGNAITFNNMRFVTNFGAGTGVQPQINANNATTDIGHGRLNYSYTRWVSGFIYNRSKDSIQLAVGDTLTGSSATSYLNMYPFSQDQFAPDRLAWRTTDSTGRIIIERDLVDTYGGSSWARISNSAGISLFPYLSKVRIDSLPHALTATAKMVTWDSVNQVLETRAIPGGGSQGLQDVITVDPVLTANNIIDAGGNDLQILNIGQALFQADTWAINGLTSMTLHGEDLLTLSSNDTIRYSSDGGYKYIDTKRPARITDTTGQDIQVINANGIIRRIPSGLYAGGGLTVGTTPIASSTNTRVLKVNSDNTLGEYPITGTGNVVLATSPTIGNYTLSGAGTSGAVTVTNTASDFIIGNGVATATFRLLPFGTDIFFDNPVAGDQVFRTNVTERMRIANSTGVISGSIFSGTTGFRVNNAAASRKMLVGNGTNFVASTETWAVPGTTGNVLTSDGTNWVSSAPTLTGTATLNFDLSAVNSQDLTLTVTGAASGDAVALGLDPASVSADITFFGWVSATNTVTIRCSRVGGGGAVDPASGTFRARVIKF